MTRLRSAVPLSLLMTVALVVAGCGGSDSEVSSSTDVNELLTKTFTGSKKVESGNLDLSIEIAAEGGESQLEGPVNVSLSGPFQTQDGGKLPEFKLEAAFEGAGQSIKAGATSTGDKGYVSFQGTDYVVDDQVFRQFKAGFEQAQKQGSEQDQSFASLGMDPRKWLTSPKNEGDAKVGDEDTIKITGGIDVAKLLDDVNNALGKASSLGLQGAGQVPEKLTEAQKRQVIEAVKDPRVEIYTGKEDTILRRLRDRPGDRRPGEQHQRHGRLRRLDHRPQRGPGHRRAGRREAVQGPARPVRRPRRARRRRRPAPARAPARRPRGGGSSEDLEKFSECVTEAGEDTEKARKCSELLTP